MTESNLSEIPNEVIRKALCETIEKKLKSKKNKIIVSSASTAGESNFVGIVYRVLFSKENEAAEKYENKDYKLILKLAPQNEARRLYFQSRGLFLQEIYMYDKVNQQVHKF